MMPIRACWDFVVKFCRKWHPAKRRRQGFGFFTESFEPRRLLSAFFVNSFGDSHDAIPGDGIAADADGLTTLRAATEEANALVGADSIALPPGRINVIGNGFTVTDSLTIHGAGDGQSIIDGSAVDRVFQLEGGGSLSLSGVRVNSARELAAALRSNLITTNSRQADLIIAFSAAPNAPLPVDTKPFTTNTSFTANSADNILDRIPLLPVISKLAKATNMIEKPARPDGVLIPTPDAAIEDIVNALFEREASDLVLPIGAEQPLGVKKPSTPMAEDGSSKPAPMPMSDSDRPATPSTEDKPSNIEVPVPFEDIMSNSNNGDDDGFEYSLAGPVPNEAVQAVLSGWATDAGWQASDFWTNSSLNQLAPRPESGRKLAAMAVVALSGITAQAWTSGPSWLRESVNISVWQRRLDKLRRRAR